MAEAVGVEEMHRRLAACDRESAARLHPNDLLRVLRALEVYEITGAPMSQLHQSHGFQQPAYACCKIGLDMDRNALYRRIDRRVVQMFEAGLLAETRRFVDTVYLPDVKYLAGVYPDWAEIGGFEGVSLQPAAGAQGELAGVLMIRAYLTATVLIGKCHRTRHLPADGGGGVRRADGGGQNQQIIVGHLNC